MITLGMFDSGILPASLTEYMKRVQKLTGLPDDASAISNKLRGDQDGEWVEFSKVEDGEEMKVADVQQCLKSAGFLPEGQIDGICGYRTIAAIRLFQEYVRTVEGMEDIGSPDGMLGSKSYKHIRRWQNRKADWLDESGRFKRTDNHRRGLEFLKKVQEHYLRKPNKMLSLVNEHAGSADTLKVKDWKLDPDDIHLIGVRKNSPDTEGKFNDVFFLLIRGAVFTFFGSTDPGYTKDPRGFPFLAYGQHLYRFGWHGFSNMTRVYQALKPKGPGVLVARSKDRVLTDLDLDKGLEVNNSINVHWGGKGFSTDIARWSAGCQVITGKGYINNNSQLINCTKYAALKYEELGKTNGGYKTKGAYTVLSDVVAAFSGSDNVLRYMLLNEDDLSMSPEVTAMINGARKQFKNIPWG